MSADRNHEILTAICVALGGTVSTPTADRNYGVLQDILAAVVAGGGGGGVNNNSQGAGPPSSPPVDPTKSAFYTDTATGRVYPWKIATQEWL